MAIVKALFLTIVCLVGLKAVQSSVTSKIKEPCPDLSVDMYCKTGSCRKITKPYYWKIPSNCPLLEANAQGKYTIEGTLHEDTDIPGTRIKVSRRSISRNCCSKCKDDNKCTFWQHLDLGNYGGLCFIYRGNNGPKCDFNMLVKTRAGAKCRNTSIDDDPHLVGAHGTPYDFSGVPNKSFCLMSDRNLHINMRMTGYLDDRTESATLLQDGKAVRTWIRELGLMWTVNGERHSLRLVARAGKETARGDGFLALAEADGAPLARMQPGDVLALEGGLTIKFQAVEKKGTYDVDLYTVEIADLLNMDVRLRVANPLLQTPEDAETHISLGFNYVKTTPSIHGVLGQTYRDDREARAIEFTKLAALLHHNIAADGESGKGFLDGVPADYVSSSVMAADCKFSQFQEPAMIAEVVDAQ